MPHTQPPQRAKVEGCGVQARHVPTSPRGAGHGAERQLRGAGRVASRARPNPRPSPAAPPQRAQPRPAANQPPPCARPPAGGGALLGGSAARALRCGPAGDGWGTSRCPQRFPAARRAFILHLGAVNPRRVPTHLPAARRLGIQNGGRPALTQWRRIGAPRSAPPATWASASLAPSPPGRAPSRRAPFRRERPGQSGGRTFSSPPSPLSRGGMRVREPRVLPPPLPEWLRP